MTSPSIRAFLLSALLAWLGNGCGRSALSMRDAQSPPSTTTATVPSITSSSPTEPTSDGTCPAGLVPCGRGAATHCYDLTRSLDHCGECGHACAPGIACQSSRCQQYQCKGALTFRALPEIATALAYEVPHYSRYLPALGDFNRDGTLDFVGQPAIKAPMSLLLGKGDGTFTSHPIATAFAPSWQARAADLNGDGWLDLATITAEQSAVMVRLGNGDPTSMFASATTYPTVSAPGRLLLADLNYDGHVDLVTSEKNGLGLWWGSAEGSLAKSSAFFVGTESSLLMAADWNRDGVLDLVFGTNTLRMLLGNGDGTFDDEIACGLAVPHNTLADFDHDQKIDLVARNTGVLLGMNGCNFTSLVPLPSWGVLQSSGESRVADLNGDGHADIVSSLMDLDAQISVFLGNGRGGFSEPKNFPGTGRQHDGSSLFGDLNRDTKLDIIFTAKDGWRVLLNTCP